LAALIGFNMGLLIWSSTIRWIYSIWQVAKQRSDTDQAELVPWVSVLLLHSGPWLVVAAAAFVYYILSKPHEPWWV